MYGNCIQFIVGPRAFLRVRTQTKIVRGTMLTRKSKLLLSLTAATPLLFSACTDNGIFNPLSDVAGTYQLSVYAGRTVPASYTIQPNDPNYPSLPNGATLVVTGGNLVLRTNGTFTETNAYTITPNGGSAYNDSFVSQGTWSLNGGSQVTLSAPATSQSSPSRYVTASWTVNAATGKETVNYQEYDSANVPQSFEYQR